jgi:putative glutamine amidotransferase
MAVAAAGGLPVLLPPIAELAAEHARRCDAVVFTGGDDPRTEPFGRPTHPKATPVRPERQMYESALLEILRERQPRTPVLGVCLGMQMMALHAGGVLNQHMPDTMKDAARHWDASHAIVPGEGEPLIRGGMARSKHRQAVEDPGSLKVIARADDGVIEAVRDLSRPFYVGVQWHPERTEDAGLGAALFKALVAAARGD